MTERRKQRIERVLRCRQPTLTVVMEDIHDPHNVSAVLRSADAVGVRAVQLVYVNAKFPRLGKKSSASAVKWVERRAFRSITECFATLREEGFMIYATRLAEKAASLYDVDLTKKVALVFGNEHRGVSDEATERADGIIQIPMVGMIRSLNVSVACAVCLYEAFRQRSRAGMHDTSQLPADELLMMTEQWMKK
jgi:tRNA (guanosine-2'-O-)-methyltransferase